MHGSIIAALQADRGRNMLIQATCMMMLCPQTSALLRRRTQPRRRVITFGGTGTKDDGSGCVG